MLDFSNAVQELLINATEDDSVFVLAINDKKNYAYTVIHGDQSTLIAAVSAEGYLNDSSERVTEIRQFILNAAINICNENADYLSKLREAANNLHDKKSLA